MSLEPSVQTTNEGITVTILALVHVDKLCQPTPPHPMVTMNISLPDPMKAWVETQSQDGRYANVSDYMRDLIRRDQARQAAVKEVQTLVDEGIESGPARPFDMTAFLTARDRA